MFMYPMCSLTRIYLYASVTINKLCSVSLCNPLSLERGYKDTLHINLRVVVAGVPVPFLGPSTT